MISYKLQSQSDFISRLHETVADGAQGDKRRQNLRNTVNFHTLRPILVAFGHLFLIKNVLGCLVEGKGGGVLVRINTVYRGEVLISVSLGLLLPKSTSKETRLLAGGNVGHVYTQCHMGRVKRICVFEHSVMTNFNCACPAIQRGQGSGFLSEGSS